MKMSKFRRLAIENIKDVACDVFDISYNICAMDEMELNDASDEFEELAKRLMDIYQMLRPEEL